MQVDVAAASRKCSQYLRRRSIGRQEQVRPVENKSSGRQTDVGVIHSRRETDAWDERAASWSIFVEMAPRVLWG